MSNGPDDPESRAQARNAFAFVLAKLGRRDHTEKELRTALARKEYPAQAVDAALSKARREGLVNDERLARGLARMTARAGKRGPRRVVAALRLKGISAETAQAVTKEAFAASEEAPLGLLRFATRLLARAKGDTPSEKRTRVVRSLLTRGFELSEARRVVRLAQTALMTENTGNDADE